MGEDSRLQAERELRVIAEVLQGQLQRDEHLAEKARLGLVVKQLLMDDGALRIRMHQERNHATPHVHLSYGSNYHAISIQVRPVKLLEGDTQLVPAWAIKRAFAWVVQHETTLLKIWSDLRAGGDPKPLIMQLRGYAG